MKVSGLTLLICTLAVWRATRLLQVEDGPWNTIRHLRSFAGKVHAARALDCFYCLSLWVAIPFSFLIARSVPEGMCLWLALSGAAILLQRSIEYAEPSLPVWSEAPVTEEPRRAYEETTL